MPLACQVQRVEKRQNVGRRGSGDPLSLHMGDIHQVRTDFLTELCPLVEETKSFGGVTYLRRHDFAVCDWNLLTDRALAAGNYLQSCTSHRKSNLIRFVM